MQCEIAVSLSLHAAQPSMSAHACRAELSPLSILASGIFLPNRPPYAHPTTVNS
jgi:hypothetical protein